MQEQIQEQIGQPTRTQFDEVLYYQINGHTFHQTESKVLYSQYYGEKLHQKDSLHIIVGTDSGLLPLYLTNNEIPEGSHYLFIELTEVIQSDLLQELIPLLPTEITITDEKSFKFQVQKHNLTDFIYLDSVYLSDSFAVRDASIAGYHELSTNIRQIVNSTAYDVIMGLGSKNYINRQIDNLTENTTSAAILKSYRPYTKDRTAVILGGGPSLDEFLPWVKDNYDHLTVFAISRISRRLLECQITPHFIVSIDPAEVNFSKSREMLLFPKGPVLLNANHINSTLLSTWPGERLYLGQRTPWESSLNKEALEPWGPTVTNTALGAAVEMGFSQVLLMGVDLCFNDKGITHAAGSDEYESGPRLDTPLTVTTNSGSSAGTDHDYYSAIKFLSEQAAEAKNQDCKVISPAQNAAKVKNVTYQPIDKVTLTETSPADKLEIMNKLAQGTDNLSRQDTMSVLKELNQVSSQLRKIVSLCSKGIQYSQKMKSSKKSETLSQKIKQIDQQLNNDFCALTPLIKRYGIRSFLKIKLETERANKSGIDFRDQLKQYFDAFRKSTNTLAKRIEQATKRTESRLEENKEKPDFGAITSQWIADGQQARILSLLSSKPHLLEEITENETATFKTMQKESLLYIKQRISAQGSAQSLRPVLTQDTARSIANRAFKQNNVARLNTIADQICTKSKFFDVVMPLPIVVDADTNNTLPLEHGEYFYLNIFLSQQPAPTTLNLHWQVGEIDHQIYWGAKPQTTHTNSRLVYAGDLPATGEWTLLFIPLSMIKFDPAQVLGFCTTTDQGHVWWDLDTEVTTSPQIPERTSSPEPETAILIGKGWDWIDAYRQGDVLCCQYFDQASVPFSIKKGDFLNIRVNLHPENPPRTVMLQFHTKNWNHRAFWGSHDVPVGGTEDDICRRHKGPLPQTGKWIDLCVSAKEVGLEGKNINGFSILLLNGQGKWKRVGKTSLHGLTTEWFDDELPQGSRNRSFRYLTGYDIPSPMKALIALINGYKQELCEEPENALKSYRDLVLSYREPATQELALNRIFKISSQRDDMSNCLLALECLTDLSLNYAPAYARLLKLTNNHDSAICVYETYLQAFPSDAQVMLDLGKLYDQTGARDKAREMFQHIIEIDTNQTEARKLLNQLETSC